jgi:hypothetical protein
MLKYCIDQYCVKNDKDEICDFGLYRLDMRKYKNPKTMARSIKKFITINLEYSDFIVKSVCINGEWISI